MGQVPIFRNGEFAGSVDSSLARDDCDHDDLEDIGTCPEGCCDEVRCKKCGKTFFIEVPD